MTGNFIAVFTVSTFIADSVVLVNYHFHFKACVVSVTTITVLTRQHIFAVV